jgi:hypothetical protein
VNLPLFDSEGVSGRKSSKVDNPLDRIGDDRLICAEKVQASTKLQAEEATIEIEA